MTLPDDIRRCWDHACGVAMQCERYVQRQHGGGGRVIHASTLKDGWIPHSRPCAGYIGEAIVEDDE